MSYLFMVIDVNFVMLNFSLEDKKKYNRVLCNNIARGDLLIRNACCIGNSANPQGKLTIYLDVDEGYVIKPGGNRSVFLLEASVKKYTVLSDPILVESKEYQATTSNDQSDIVVEMYVVVFENSLKDFQRIVLDNISKDRCVKCASFLPVKFRKSKTYVKCTNISNFCYVKFVKPKTYADMTIGFNAGKSLLEIGGFSDAEFVMLGKPSALLKMDLSLRLPMDNSEKVKQKNVRSYSI